MPVYFNDAIDDPLVYDLCGTFVGGQVSNVRENLLKQEQFFDGKNMDIDRFGSIISRKGTGIIGAALSGPIRGLGYYDTPSLEKLVSASNGSIYQSTGGAWSEVTGYTPDSSENVEMAQLIDKVYFTDGGISNVHSLSTSTFTDEGSGGSDDPPKCKYLITHTNRLFCANTTDNDDEVAASDILDGSTWRTAFSFRVGGGEGDPITGIISWYNHNLLVFKQHSIHVVNADPSQTSAAGWAVNRIDNTVGCIAHRTIAQAGADVFFLARDGVRTVRTILSGAQSSVEVPISAPIDDLINRINWSAAHTSTAIFWKNKYIVAVPLDSAASPDHVLVFNTVTKTWNGYWVGWVPNCFEISMFSGFPKLVFGDNEGLVLESLDYVADANEVQSTYQDIRLEAGTSNTEVREIESHLITRGLTFGDYFSPKLGNSVEFELGRSSAGCECVEVRSVTDTVTETVLTPSHIDTGVVGITLPATLPFTLGRQEPIINSYNLTPAGNFSELQFKLSSSAGKLNVRSVKASAFINSMDFEKSV